MFRSRIEGSLFALTLRLKRIVWSNRIALSIAAKAVDLVYLARRRGHRSKKSKEQNSAQDMAVDLSPFFRYRTQYEHLGGWLLSEAAATWSCLLALQVKRGVRGDLMEIGVFRGRSAALIALHARPEEALVLVDLVMRREAIDVIQGIRPDRNVFVHDLSRSIGSHETDLFPASSFRWIHIDGEHSARAVVNDLEETALLLGTDGIICLDDFMNVMYPQITMAAFRFLEQQNGAFTLFLCGFNKGYICRTHAARPYLEYLRDRVLDDLERRDVKDVTVCKTTEPDDMNCFGLRRKKGQFRYLGPDWAPAKIPI